MKKFSFVFYILILGSFAIVFNGCSENKGCTDPDSYNFDIDAEKDDGSCMYEGDVVFWYGEDAAIGLVDDEAVTLTFYVDGYVVGANPANFYWSGPPNCNEYGTITVSKDLGGSRTKSFDFSVEDQTGWVYWSDNMTFSANECTKIELTWFKMNSK